MRPIGKRAMYGVDNCMKCVAADGGSNSGKGPCRNQDTGSEKPRYTTGLCQGGVLVCQAVDLGALLQPGNALL